MKKVKQRQSKLVIKRIKAKSGADAVAKKFGEDKEFRTRVVPNKKRITKYLSTLNQLVSPNYDKDKQITITMDFAENDIKDYKHWLENEGRELMFKTRERINKDKK